MWIMKPSAVTRATTALAAGIVSLGCAAGLLSPASASARPSHHASRSGRQLVSVMSYNILTKKADGRREGGTRVAPWSERRGAEVQLIERSAPDVISVQEGGDWVGAPRGKRQVDDLRDHLGGAYGLAHTEIPPSHRHFFRTGCYILYKRASYKAVGHGGHWALGQRRWAAFQVLKSRVSRAKFLFVNPHLIVNSQGGTDPMRGQETRIAYLHAKQFAANHNGLPIVFAGDFNSDWGKKHAYNAPKRFMQAMGYHDAFSA